MADAYKCDRCGEFDEGSPPLRLKSIGGGETAEDELCEDCWEEFDEWFFGPEQED